MSDCSPPPSSVGSVLVSRGKSRHLHRTTAVGLPAIRCGKTIGQSLLTESPRPRNSSDHLPTTMPARFPCGLTPTRGYTLRPTTFPERIQDEIAVFSAVFLASAYGAVLFFYEKFRPLSPATVKLKVEIVFHVIMAAVFYSLHGGY